MSQLVHLIKDQRGLWQATLTDGSVHNSVTVVRAFPIRAPDEAISVIDHEGHELCWIEHVSALNETVREAVVSALQAREFMPEILKLYGVSGFVAPSTWDIETDRGRTKLLLKGEEDIRRLSGKVLLVTDGHGVQFLIRDLAQMDRDSRKLLDRFL